MDAIKGAGLFFGGPEMVHFQHLFLLLVFLLGSCLAQEQEARRQTARKEKNARLREEFLKTLMIGKRMPYDQETVDHMPGGMLRMLKRTKEQKQYPVLRRSLVKRVRGPGGGPAWYAMLK